MASSPRTYRYRPVVARGEHHVEFEDNEAAARGARVSEDMQQVGDRAVPFPSAHRASYRPGADAASPRAQSESRPRGWRAPLWQQYRPLGEPDLSLATYRLPPLLDDTSRNRARDAGDALFSASSEMDRGLEAPGEGEKVRTTLPLPLVQPHTRDCARRGRAGTRARASTSCSRGSQNGQSRRRSHRQPAPSADAARRRTHRRGTCMASTPRRSASWWTRTGS